MTSMVIRLQEAIDYVGEGEVILWGTGSANPKWLNRI